jgi:cellulose biosynthesis protein BcsQ
MDSVRLPLPTPVQEMPGHVVTLYGYQGGVGRTLATANLGLLLARRASAPVLLLDWDLAAPGLAYYFPGVAEGPGLLELFEACTGELCGRPVSAAGDAALARAVLADLDWEQYLVRPQPGLPLFLIRAGRQDASFAERVARLDWQLLFDACPALFSTFAALLAQRFSHVLVDAPSGRSDCASVCTSLLPDRLLLLFTPNRQQLRGLQAMVARVTSYRRSQDDEARPLLVYPVARVDEAAPDLACLWRRGQLGQGIPGYQPLFEQALADAYGNQRVSLEAWFDATQLPYCPELACGEPLLGGPGEEGAGRALTLRYEALLNWLRVGASPWMPPPDVLAPGAAQARATPRWHAQQESPVYFSGTAPEGLLIRH